MKCKNVLGLIRKCGAALGFLAMAQAAHAGLIVESAVSALGGGLFHYDFSIENSGPTDVLIVSILNAPLADPDIDASLMTPAGFSANYDPGLGIVDFLEDTALFSVGPKLSGFGFDSAAGPVSSFFDVFTALDLNGHELTGQVAHIPEPTTLALIVLGGVVLTRVRGQRAVAI